MELTFDIRGHLIPHNRIEVSLDQFEEIFVSLFDTDSTRTHIFQEYLRFLKDFKEEITENFTHWIDGSFVTTTKNPRDIDFVTLIHHVDYEQKRELIDHKYRLKQAKEDYGVDAYTVEVFSKEHEKHLICRSDLLYWDEWFRKTKRNRAKRSFPKGYIEIKFGN
ncbi:MAG: hypothetical protein R3E32_06375 [Chitinophagales bacterium]